MKMTCFELFRACPSHSFITAIIGQQVACSAHHQPEYVSIRFVNRGLTPSG